MASSMFNRIFRFRSGNISNYSNVEGEPLDLELNVPQSEETTSIESDGNNNNESNNKNFIISKLIQCKQKMYSLFVKRLNKFMEWPKDIVEDDRVTTDAFVLKFMFFSALILQNPTPWFLTVLLLLGLPKEKKKYFIWAYVQIGLTALSTICFLYAVFDPLGMYSKLPRIEYQYRTVEKPKD